MRATSLFLFFLLLLFVPATGQQEPDSTATDSSLYESTPYDSSSYASDTTDQELEDEEADDTVAANPHVVRFDSSSVALRTPPGRKLNDFRSDNDFVYEHTQHPPRNLWEQIKEWLMSLLSAFFESSAAGPVMKIIAYTLVGGTLVYVVLKLIGVDVVGMFGGDSRKTDLQAGVAEEDIHTMDFDRLLADAIARGEYRWAIRLHYMRTLKELTDMQLIAWKPEKTNQDYLHELRSPLLRLPFADITTLFEYAWYGDLPVNEPMFRQAEKRFADFRMQLSGANGVAQ
jgi:hypothetical protein